MSRLMAPSRLVRAAIQVMGLLVLGAVVLQQVEWSAVAASYRGTSVRLAGAAGVAVFAVSSTI